MTEPLTLLDLNRATLARQMLLARETVALPKAVERLCALQAQLARPPHMALWSRVAGFQREAFSKLFVSKELVRTTLLRATLHVTTANDYSQWRAAFQPMLTEGLRGVLRERLDTLDLPVLLKEARSYFTAAPHTFEEARDHLMKKFPKGDERAMGYAVRMHLPLVQVPDSSAWGFPSAASFSLAETYLSRALPTETSPNALILRYLAAFGPASVQDAQAFTGISKLKEAFELLRPQLVTFRDDRKRELFDLPNAPRPAPETPAPVRFLPDFDGLVLGHDDRTRVITEEHRKRLLTKNLRVLPVFLVDGFVAGTWNIDAKKTVAALTVEPFIKLNKKMSSSLESEALALLRFAEPESKRHEVLFKPS